MARKPKANPQAIALPELAGEAGRVRVALTGFPGLRSESGDSVRPIQKVSVDDGEGGWEELDPAYFVSTRAMFACGSYTMKLKEYLPRLIFQCRGCQKTLPEDPREEKQHFDVEMSALDVASFQLSLDAPAVACPQCGRQNVLGNEAVVTEIEAATRVAITNASL